MKHIKHKVYPKNTAVWGFDIFRQDALPRLLDDLGATNQKGIPEEICDLVKGTHDRMTDIASTLPDKSFFRKSVWQAFDGYAEAYALWNDVEGDDPATQIERRKALKNVRNKRNVLATTVRKNRHVLESELDLKIVDDIYATLGDLVKNAPEYFQKLGAAVSRYDAKRT